MSSDLVCKQQGLVELSLAEPLVVQWDRYDQVDGIQPWKYAEDEVGEGHRQGDFALVLQQVNCVFKWRGIGI